MNIDKFKHQHDNIYRCISALRRHAHAGITRHAEDIAQLIVSMSSLIKLHLAVEDKVLYPALGRSHDQRLARMGRDYQQEMQDIAAEYDAFARRWNTPSSVAANPEAFRTDANTVLKLLYQRIQREDRNFYPAIQAL